MSSIKRYPDHLWIQTALLMLAFVPICLMAYALEQRTFNGINLWVKPIKFQLSAVIHLVTLYWVAQLMDDAARRAWLFRLLVWASCIATAFEIFIITLRASQGTASHFNDTTPTDAFLYGLMGIGAITMLLPAVYLAVRFMFRTHSFKGGHGLHVGVSIGFLFAAVLTLLFAGYMSANGSHWTSGQTTDQGGLPLVGWSQTGGDLRPAHFFALHLMQFLPILGICLDQFTGFSRQAKKAIVVAALLLIGGTSVFTFNQALQGRPLLQLTLDSETKLSESQLAFWQQLTRLCGKQFEGQMTYPTAGQDAFAGKTLLATVKHCGDNEVRVPFWVGEDKSRTWVFRKTPAGLLLKHDHRHNGYADKISNYGGFATPTGTARQQAFAADPFTAELIPEAATNVWNIRLSDDGKTLVYHLERHNAPRFTAELVLSD